MFAKILSYDLLCVLALHHPQTTLKPADESYSRHFQMATRSTSVNADVRKSIRRYLAEVRKRYPFRAAYLFGSQATGHAHAWSDIDLALVSSSFAADPTESQIQLMTLAANMDWRIEPHIFAPDDFNVNHPLAAEINLSGVSLLRKTEVS